MFESPRKNKKNLHVRAIRPSTFRTEQVISASLETLYLNKKQQVARNYGDEDFKKIGPNRCY